MSITNSYATLAEMKAELRITDALDDSIIEQCVETASRLIDETCGRVFYQETTTTRYYTAECSELLFVDDLVSITTLATDDTGDRSYGTTWATTDYDLEPYNAALRGQPYTRIQVPSLGARWFPTVRRGVKVVGTFGWPAVPPLAKRACRLQAARFFKRKDAIFGVVGSAEMGQMMVIPKLDPDVALMLEKLQRLGVEAI